MGIVTLNHDRPSHFLQAHVGTTLSLLYFNTVSGTPEALDAAGLALEKENTCTTCGALGQQCFCPENKKSSYVSSMTSHVPASAVILANLSSTSFGNVTPALHPKLVLYMIGSTSTSILQL